MWSSLLLYFVTWCNYAFCKGGVGWGRGQKGTDISFASLFYGFCVHGVTPLLAGKGWARSQALRSAQWGIQGPVSLGPALPGVGGLGRHSYQPAWPRISIPSCAVLVSLVRHEAPEGPSTLPHCSFSLEKKFSTLAEFRTLASSGNQPTFSLIADLNLYVNFRNHLLALF